MNPTLPLLLLLEAARGAGAERTLSSAERVLLERFSARWSVELEPIRPLSSSRDGERPHAFPASEPIVRRIEELLDAARQASARLDEPDAANALEQASALLTQHPELPQAAWLRAEHLTLSAERARAQGAEREAAELHLRAHALEGSRALPFEEQRPALAEPGPVSAHTLALLGLDARDSVEWNGARVEAPFHVSALPGEHALRIFRRGRLVSASWVELAPSMNTLSVELPQVTPCSAEDLADTAIGQERPRPAPGVLCASWAVARRTQGTLALARCSRSTCGPWEQLRAEPSAVSPQGRAEVKPGAGFPRWASITLATAGAMLATSFVLWQAGAFDTRTETRERWVYEGLKPAP